MHSEMTLADLVRSVWDGRGFVLGGLVLGLVCALGFVLSAVPHSRAQMVLAPASPLEAMAGNMRDEDKSTQSAALAGMNFDRFQSVAKGAAVASLLLRSAEIEAGLKADHAFRFLSGERNWNPSKLAEYISKRVRFVPVGETQLRVMRYEHPNPEFASAFLQRLHSITDGVIRHAVRQEVGERISYLQSELGKVYNPDHRRALTDLLMEQERLKMLVSIDQPYAALSVEQAYSSSRPVWPDKALMFSAFGLIGAFLGFIAFSFSAVGEEALFADDRGVHDAYDTQDAREARKAKEKLKSMRQWMPGSEGNANERPLTGKGRKKRPPLSSSDAAE